MPFENL